MAKIRKIYDETVKPDGSKQTIYPITSTRAVYTTTNVTIDTLLSEGYRFGGVVSTTDSPAFLDQRTFYVASLPGTYTTFGNLTVANDESAFLLYDGSTWSKLVYLGTIDTSKIADGAVTLDKLNTTVKKTIEKFNISVSCSPANIEIVEGADLTTTLNFVNKIDTFGDTESSTVVPSSSSYTVTGGTVEGNTWTLPVVPGSNTILYTATYNEVTKVTSSSVNTYLRKYFGFASEQPSDVTDLSASDASATVSCTVLISAQGTGFKHIYFAVPNNMTITSITQPDSLNAPLAFDYIDTVTRVVNDTTYTYKLYASTDTIDSSLPKRLTIN